VAITDLLNIRRQRAYKLFWESPEGRSVLADMCRAHGVFDGGFDPDPYMNAFNSGERNVVLRVITILGLKPEQIQELSQED